MTYIILGALASWVAATVLVLRFMAAAAPPCCCPVTFTQYVMGRRCQKHAEQTEVTR